MKRQNERIRDLKKGKASATAVVELLNEAGKKVNRIFDIHPNQSEQTKDGEEVERLA